MDSPPVGRPTVGRIELAIAGLAVAAIATHLVLQYGVGLTDTTFGVLSYNLPLLAALALGGIPLVVGLIGNALRAEFGSDLLAGVSIVTSVLLEEYLAGTLVVLMLSGGKALEAYAVRRASSALVALAKRVPLVARRKEPGGSHAEVPLDDVRPGDLLIVLPHDVCPVDGTVVEGHGSMDESYLTGEPYLLPKAPGTPVLSGAINGETALVIRADRRAVDSRYASIMRVMRESEQRRPRLRRLGDQLGAVYTPLAVAVAVAAWAASGDPVRFLAVLVVATPCPLLIGIPTAIIGAVSLAARRGIVVRDPAALEKATTCRTAIFDKTGTLTYGRPNLTEVIPGPGFAADEVLALVGSLERYSKHPLAGAVLDAVAVRGIALRDAAEVREPPGQGLFGVVDGRLIRVLSRKQLLTDHPEAGPHLPPTAGGLECVAAIDGRYAGTLRFRDRPRADGQPFIRHLSEKHGFDRVMLVSGDREEEVRYLAEVVGIPVLRGGQSPEQKVAIVREEAARANTLFVGDGVNDAPALAAATVGVAFGSNSDVTSEAAGVVVMESHLGRVDEFLHIGGRLRAIALQSAVGGMVASVGGMAVAAAGYLPPVAGAVVQEVIDVLAVLNALRMSFTPRTLRDY
jgi:heavy metal translocating P-type ATPase